MQYTKTEVKNFEQKDRRISFLSVFSSLCTMYENQAPESLDAMVEKALEVTERLYKEYPIIEENEGEEIIDLPA